ncbi:Cysteine--tRNA ligase [Folsomia candida]|uniref:Cysteine--tRNA ligase n=1 Tax=Folsomia candida TaxID=158441 RepID=A0A226DYK4_FOLCA|nr:Cysteine--tRNA ligase [Folsomia candida]
MLSKGEAYFKWWLAGLYLSNLSFSIPYKWDARSESVVLIGSRSRRIYNVTVFLHATYFVVMSTNLAINYGSMELPELLKGLVTLFAWAFMGTCRTTLFFWEKEFRLLFNGFLGFEKSFLKRFTNIDPSIRKRSLFRCAVFFFGTFTCQIFGLVVAFLLWVRPCTPPYLGSMTSMCLSGKEPVPRTWPEYGIKIATVSFEGMMWLHMGPPCCFVIGNTFQSLSL